MAIFLSYNNTQPYNTLVDLRNTATIEVSANNGTSTVDNIYPMYIIVTERIYPKLEIKVENENSTGVSLYISSVDIVGTPIHWTKSITLLDIDATITDVKVLIQCKWTAINNIYVLKRTQVSGNINIYEV